MADEVMTKKKIVVLTDEMQAGWDLIDQAFSILEQVRLPIDYLANLRTSTIKAHLEACDPNMKFRRYCYLAFFGDGDAATYLKVGLSKSPSNRIKGLTTGNPLKLMWSFACDLSDVRVAWRVEQAILHHFKGQRAQGEWVAIGTSDYEAAKAMVTLVRPVAEVAAGYPVSFFELAE